MASTPLTEFLVSIRFRTDETSENNANKSISNMEKQILALGALTVGFGLKALQMQRDWSKSTNAIWLATNRLGVRSTREFKAMGLAAESVGSSVATLQDSLETIAQTKFEFGAGGLGRMKLIAPDITAEDDPATIYKKMLESVASAKRRGESGVSVMAKTEGFIEAPLVRQLYEGGEDFLKKWQERTDNFSKDLGESLDKYGKVANEEEVAALRLNATNSGKLGETFGSVAPTITKGMDDLREVISKTNPELVTALNVAKEEMGNLKNAIMVATGAILGSTLARGGVAAAGAGGVLGGLATGAGALLTGGLAALGIGEAAKSINAFSKGEKQDESRWSVQIGEKIGTTIYDMFHSPMKDTTDKFKSAVDKVIEGVIPSANASEMPNNLLPKVPLNQLTNQNEFMSTLMSMGHSKNESAAILANLQAESSMDPFAVGDKGKAYGLMQWHPSRRQDYTSLFGHTMESVKDKEKAMQEQLQFMEWELKNTEATGWSRVKAIRDTAASKAATFSRQVVRPGTTEEAKANEAERRAKMAEGFVSNTTINVYDKTGDPKTVGQEIYKEAEQSKNRQFARYQGVQHG